MTFVAQVVDASSSTAAWVQAWAAVATALIALIAVVYAALQVYLARQDREDRSRPFVAVVLSPSHGIVANIVVENTGATMARNVRFVFAPEWESSDLKRTKIRESRIWTEGIPNLAPGQRIAMFADTFPDRFNTELPQAYDVTVQYDGEPRTRVWPSRAQRRNYEDSFVLDFRTFWGYSSATVYGLHEIADAVRSIKQTFAGWSKHAGGPLAVVPLDPEDYADRPLAWPDDDGSDDGLVDDRVRLHDRSTRSSPDLPITRPPVARAPRDSDDERGAEASY